MTAERPHATAALAVHDHFAGILLVYCRLLLARCCDTTLVLSGCRPGTWISSSGSAILMGWSARQAGRSATWLSHVHNAEPNTT